MRRQILSTAVYAVVGMMMFVSGAMADDWVLNKVRGGAFVFNDGQWVQLKRGDVVSDDSAIQTAKRSRAVFFRGKESISLGPDTRIRISDKAGKLDTVVSQDFGEITVDVEKRNVQHFAVRAPLLAAVVKGTKFTVRSRGEEASIDVERGRVEAQDEKAGMKVDVLRSQRVGLNRKKRSILMVEGPGRKEPIRSMTTNEVMKPKEIVANAAKAHPSAPVTKDMMDDVTDHQEKAKAPKSPVKKDPSSASEKRKKERAKEKKRQRQQRLEEANQQLSQPLEVPEPQPEEVKPEPVDPPMVEEPAVEPEPEPTAEPAAPEPEPAVEPAPSQPEPQTGPIDPPAVEETVETEADDEEVHSRDRPNEWSLEEIIEEVVEILKEEFDD